VSPFVDDETHDVSRETNQTGSGTQGKWLRATANLRDFWRVRISPGCGSAFSCPWPERPHSEKLAGMKSRFSIPNF